MALNFLMFHFFSTLPIIFPNRRKTVYHHAIGKGIAAVGHIGRYHIGAACGKDHFFITNDHFQLAGNNVGNLLMHMVVQRQFVALLYFPKGQTTLLTMDEAAMKAGHYFPSGDIFYLYHIVGL